MNINQLKYLVETIKAGSINKAAENLYMTQSSLSAAIANLEKELNIILLERSPQGVTLTPCGRIIYEDALDILSTVHKWETLSVTNLQEKFDILLFSIPTYYNGFLNDFILDFVFQYPNINIILKERSRIDILSALHNKDVGITLTCFYASEQEEYETLIQQKHFEMDLLFQDSYCIYVSNTHPFAQYSQIRSEDLQGLSAIIYSDQQLKNEPQFKYLNQHSLIKLNCMKNIIQMVAQNKGFTLMPKSLQQYHPEIHALQLLPDLEQDTELVMNCALIYPSKRSLSPVENTVITAIKQFVQTI